MDLLPVPDLIPLLDAVVGVANEKHPMPAPKYPPVSAIGRKQT
jgi:hypothetical protein